MKGAQKTDTHKAKPSRADLTMGLVSEQEAQIRDYSQIKQKKPKKKKNKKTKKQKNKKTKKQKNKKTKNP
jgi:hypothetical protein